MLSPRAAAHVLAEIATLLELRGESRLASGAYETASRALSLLAVDDLTPLLRTGDVAVLGPLGQDALDVLRDVAETGDSQFLEQLRENTPEGLLEMLRVPGLGTARIHRIHEGLGIESLHELEQAARDGRLASLPHFGQRTAEKVLRGIANLRESGARVLYPHAALDAERLLAAVRAHPMCCAPRWPARSGAAARRLQTSTSSPPSAARHRSWPRTSRMGVACARCWGAAPRRSPSATTTERASTCAA
ncbi:MAG: hypothetical protein IPG88_13755 [Gemmatimonadetes bacterium]|nr:hypothetical protein [Gemmatimonadota bacterium]